MDVISYLKNLVDKFNEEGKCDFCWAFSAPMQRNKINIQQLREDSKCCVQVMFTQDNVTAFEARRTYNNTTTFETDKFCVDNFTIWFLIPSVMGQNNYNEIDGHPIEESRSIDMMRLKDCIACEFEYDFCELVGHEVFVDRWQGFQEMDKFDNIYIGYRVEVTLRSR